MFWSKTSEKIWLDEKIKVVQKNEPNVLQQNKKVSMVYMNEITPRA